MEAKRPRIEPVRHQRDLRIRTSIANLPDAALEEVFSWLPQESVLSAVPLVCRRWRDLVAHRYPCRQLCIKTFRTPIKHEAVLRTVSRAYNLESLELLFCGWLANEVLPLLPTARLRRLDLNFCLDVEWNLLESLFVRCPGLTHLSICRVRAIGSRPEHPAKVLLPNLRELEVNGGIRPLAMEFGELIFGSEKLHTVCVSGHCIKDKDIIALSQQCSASLTDVWLDCGCFTDAGLEALGSCRGLRSLVVVLSRGITNAGLAALAPLTNLHTLRLVSRRQIRFTHQPDWCSFFRNSPCVRGLTDLQLGKWCNVDDSVASAIAAACPLLELVSLVGTGVTKNCRQELLRHCPNLKEENLSLEDELLGIVGN